jgi:tetratricopeptide (TPR) repeat protein
MAGIRDRHSGSHPAGEREKENDMTPQKNKNSDWKLLLGIGGSLVAVVVLIAILARLGADWEAREASVAAPVESEVVEAEESPPVGALPDQAEPVVEEAPGSFPIDPDADFVAMGRMAYANREWDTAAAYWQAEVDANPERAYGHYMLGLSLWKGGRLDEATAALRAAGRLNPESVKTFINLSRVLNERGDYDSALEAAEIARGVDSEHPQALYLQARSLRNLGRIDDAVVALEQALAFDPAYGHAWNLLGLIDIHRGRAADAVDSLRNAAALEPGIAYIHANHGRALELSGRYAEAAEVFRAAIDVDPEGSSARICLARVQAKMDETEPSPLTQSEGETVASIDEESAVADVIGDGGI